MNPMKLEAGAALPTISVSKLGGGELTLGVPEAPYDWQLVVVYRGKHCPLCTRFLGELNDSLPALNELGVDLVAVSADPLNKTQDQIEPLDLKFKVGYDLSLAQMQQLGLYISHPRSPEENDRPFAEPGMFAINAEGKLQLVDYSNAPFLRPHLPGVIAGLGFIRNPDNNYPIRGTHNEAS